MPPAEEEWRLDVLAKIRSSAVMGIDAFDIDVEVDVANGLPSFEVVGLPGTSVREARDRVRTAIKNAGFVFPLGRVTVNLAPAHIPKSGTFYDLPIAIGVLMASQQISVPSWIDQAVFLGELSLDGSLRPVRGALCVAASAAERDLIVVASGGNRDELSSFPGIRLTTADTLRGVVQALTATPPSQRTVGVEIQPTGITSDPWNDVVGQATAKRALEIAVAGGHHTMLMGPPGAGKTMLARSALHLAPPLSIEDSIDVSRIYSVAGLLSSSSPIVAQRPFRSPHHSVTLAGLLGGGLMPRPGEVSLAHRGILFLDEFAEFDRRALEALREPLEEGMVTISRAHGTCRFPAQFTLVAALNPCPCGFLHDERRPCICSRTEIDKYRRKLSGPLMDRIDLFVRLERMEEDYEALTGDLAQVAADEDRCRRVLRAQAMQRDRFGHSGRQNVHMTPAEIHEFCRLDRESRTFLQQAGRNWSLSARAIHRSLKVARTIADLEGCEDISLNHIAESLAFRSESVSEF